MRETLPTLGLLSVVDGRLMGDVGEYWRDHKDWLKERRRKLGVNCPKCAEVRPRVHPSILLPGQRCKVDGYRDPRNPEDFRDA